MHGKMPTDENLMLRGCYIPSMCNLCFHHVETSFHLFFDCPYSINIWTWFSEMIGINLHFNSVLKTFGSCVIDTGPLSVRL
jgi:hypothetical protein